ncbi:hypothetical protein [Pectinatus frisingensis]|uniref:hypothetical protein n=1 Tax=Pectinatus frisingensis TaxID=865 RepID=UPI0018C7D360|nr:hypothetical protein [Pectinatus frisingensis]
MSDYLVPCIASFFLGVGVTLIWLVFEESKETTSLKKTVEDLKAEVIGYDKKGADK